MNSRERVLAALNHEQPDKVPVKSYRRAGDEHLKESQSRGV